MRIRTLLNPFNCLQRYEKQLWEKIFPHFDGTLDVEVGFGTGSFLESYAKAHPTHAIVGFEIRRQLVEAAQERITQLGLENIHLVLGNCQLGLEDMFEDKSIDRLFIFHPDPWPKRQHHKRRVLNTQFLELIHQKLKLGHCLYLATDVPELWKAMLATIEETKKFAHITDDPFWTTLYHTRWRTYSLERNRSLFYGTFQALQSANDSEGSLPIE